MNKILLSVVTACALGETAMAQMMTKQAHGGDAGRNVGVGVSMEGAAGLSLYADTSAARFVQANAAWRQEGAYLLSGDYALDYPNVLAGLPSLSLFWGGGLIAIRPRDQFWTPFHQDDDEVETEFGVRLPLGANFVIPRTPIQLSGEFVPTLIATASSYTYLQGGVSARVLF